MRGRAELPPPSLPAAAIPACGKCGGTTGILGVNHLLALAMYRCPCAHQWTIDVSQSN